jgi:hypothetical protein
VSDNAAQVAPAADAPHIADGYSARPYGDGYIIHHESGGAWAADLAMVAAVREIARLRALAAPAVPVAWHCPNDPDSATAFLWRRPSNGACPNCGKKLLPVMLAAAPTAQQEHKP